MVENSSKIVVIGKNRDNTMVMGEVFLMQIRLAEEKDIKQLIKMRWDFTIEEDERKRVESFDDFEKECQTFLEKAINSNQWLLGLRRKMKVLYLTYT